MNSLIIIKEIEFVIQFPGKEIPGFQIFSNRESLQTFKELIPIFIKSLLVKRRGGNTFQLILRSITR